MELKNLTSIYYFKAIFPSALLVLIVSCDNTIDAVTEGRATYSVYGYLDINRDTNFVRIKKLDSRLLNESFQKLEAKVTLTNLSTDKTQVLQDSVIPFENVKTHAYFTTMKITPTTSYRLSVTGPNGEGISAVTTTPAIANASVQLDKVINFDWRPVHYESVFTYSLSDSAFQFNSSDNDKGFCFHIDAFGDYITIPGFCRIVMPNESNYRFLSIPKFLILNKVSDDTSFKLYVAYRHFSIGSFKPIITTDSISIPGKSGQFGSLYTDTLIFTIHR